MAENQRTAALAPKKKKRNRKALLVNVNETGINFMLLASEIN